MARCRRRESVPCSKGYLSGILSLLLIAPTTWAGTVSTLDDIDYWVGQGENRAAVVFDWDDTSAADEALVWGYRWDGTATGEEMLLEVLESDARLFAKLSIPGATGITNYGVGYDNNDDGQLAISDGTTFDANGIAFSGPPDNPPPAAVSIDAADYYVEGWFTGFWHYGVSSGNPFDGGSWVSSGSGVSNRTLTDGDWDSWAFTPTFSFTAFATNPVAAESPQFSADFDGDQDVDGADFLTWQLGFGINSGAMSEQGDADLDGAVDAADLQLWSLQFGNGFAEGPPLGETLSVPEPSNFLLILVGCSCLMFGRPHQCSHELRTYPSPFL